MNGGRDATATLFLLLDLATFFDLFHGGKLDEALDTLTKIKIIPLNQQDVDYLVAGMWRESMHYHIHQLVRFCKNTALFPRLRTWDVLSYRKVNDALIFSVNGIGNKKVKYFVTDVL